MSPVTRRTLFLLVTLFALTLMVGLADAGPGVPTPLPGQVGVDAGSAYLAGRLIVKLSPQAGAAVGQAENGYSFATLPALQQLNQRYAVSRVERLFPGAAAVGNSQQYGLPNIYVLSIPHQTDVWAMAADYAALPDVAYAEPSLLTWSLAVIPNDPEFPGQWDMDMINAPEAWDLETNTPCIPDDPNPANRCVRIAILDTGVDYTHPDVDDKLRTDLAYDFEDNDTNADEELNGRLDTHGTSVASIAAAETNNNEGVAGMCWGCEILPVRISSFVVHIGGERMAQGIEYAAAPDRGNADVINLSQGGLCTQSWFDAVNYAYEENVVIVAAAGNIVPWVVSPARFGRVIAVAAVGPDERPMSYSSPGPEVDVAAPSEVPAAMNGGGYTTFGGTSAATPHVAGLAALLLARNPNLTNAEIHQILRDTAFQIPGAPYPNDDLGYGRIQADQAVAHALTPPPDPYDPGPVGYSCFCDLVPWFCDSICAVLPDLCDAAGPLDEQAQMALLYNRFVQEQWQGTTLQRRLSDRFRLHDQQVTALLTIDPSLYLEFMDLLKEARPVISSLVEGDGQVVLSSDLIGRVEAFVRTLAERANPRLRADLWQTWRELNLWSYAGRPVGKWQAAGLQK